MTEYELNEFESDFDPVKMSESLAADNSRESKVRQFAVLKTSYFLLFSDRPGSLAVLNTQQKEAFVAIFTNREELEKWPFARQEIVEMPYEQIRRAAVENPKLDGVVINPFGKALFLRRGEIGEIDLLMNTARVGPGQKRSLRLKATMDYPIGLPLALQELGKAHPEIYRIFLLLARGEGEGLDHKLFVVDFDGKRETLFPLIANTVRLYMRQGENFELMKADISLLQIAEQRTRPLYEKK